MRKQLTALPGRVPRGLWVLGFVSMLMDVSYEVVHSQLPRFLATVLGAWALTVGKIEGLAESNQKWPAIACLLEAPAHLEMHEMVGRE